jgi:hypothetical protein
MKAFTAAWISVKHLFWIRKQAYIDECPDWVVSMHYVHHSPIKPRSILILFPDPELKLEETVVSQDRD